MRRYGGKSQASWRRHLNTTRQTHNTRTPHAYLNTTPHKHCAAPHYPRAELRPSHPFLFSRACGLPLTGNALYDMFTNAAQRRTGKATNPHLIRDMIVTHLRSRGTSEGEMEALAIYMGHSVAMQVTVMGVVIVIVIDGGGDGGRERGGGWACMRSRQIS